MNFNKTILCIFFSIFILSQSSAEDTKNEDFKIFPGEWISNCSTSTNDNQKTCLLQRSMFVDKDLKNALVTMGIQTKSSSENIRFNLVSPLGTLTQAGVKINFDKSPLSEKAFAFHICKKNGCITSIKFEQSILQKFKKAEILNLEYVTPDNQKISIKVSLAGFSKAYKSLN